MDPVGKLVNLHKKALLLAYFTVGYNILEGVASIVVGWFTGSVALVGFGSDSFVESLSGSIMIWRFKKHGKITKWEEKRIEKKATTFVSYSFFILASYVIYESLNKLYYQKFPERSSIGIIIAGLSIIIMPILFHQKYKTGKALKSQSLIADSKETLACIFLSVSLLIGLALNYLYGFWQADPVVGLLIAFFLIVEGYKTYKEKD